MWKTLTSEEKEELVQILLDCGLDDATQRKSVLARVSDEITQRIIEGDTPLIIVSSIVAKCLEFGDGIEQLVYAVHQVCGKTRHWQQLDLCVRKHYPKIVSYAEQKDLLAIMRELPQSVLMHAYSMSKLGGTSVPSFDGTSDLLAIILKDLAEFGQSDEAFPILTFLEYLAWYAHKQGQEAIRRHLQSWVSMKAIALHLSDSQLVRLRQKVQAGSSSGTEQATYLPVENTQNYFSELYSILAPLNVTQQALYEVYRSCIPEDPLRIYGYENATTLSEMLNALLVVPVDVGGMPAILKFSEHCALLSKPPIGSLRTWGNAFIQDKEISLQLLMHFRQEIEAEAKSPRAVLPPLPLHLIIVLKTSEEDPQALRVKAWLCSGQDEPDPLSSPVEGQTYTIDAMPDLLDEMLAEVQRMSKISTQAKAELSIEFFLPRSLISLPVDHWKIAEGTVVLGAQYRVVVRSLDRVESKKIYSHCAPFWEEKWKKVCTLSCGMTQEHIHWIMDAAAYDGEQVYYAFGGPDRKAICLCLALIPPSSFDRDNKKEFFRMVLRAGIPIVFWPKSLPEDPDLTEHFCKELDQLLGTYKPVELPDALFKQRWEAARHKAEEHHLGRCLTLLWDNPKRLPPDGKLLQIKQRR